MKIIYSPSYSGSYYVDLQKRKHSLLGLKVCGSGELLSELELRAGIASQHLSESERLAAYHNAIKKTIPGTVFATSFTTDEIGTARQLLVWRDNLLLAGWNPVEHRFTSKLADLARLEAGLTLRSQADRWHEIYSYVKHHRLFNADDQIEVHAESRALPLVIRNTLTELHNQGFVEYIRPLAPSSELNLKVYKFKTRTEAYQWYLSGPEVLNDVSVTVSSDNCILNDMAVSLNKPLVDSRSVDSNPQVLQLFKLGFSLFARPLNVYNLLSYLQVAGHPAKGIASRLARVLAAEGGVSEKWDEAIQAYDFTDDQGTDKRQACLEFINMVTKAYHQQHIPVDDIKSYALALANWCDEQTHSRHVSDERKEQLVVLASYCRSLIQTLKDKKEISSDKLLIVIDGIYQPQSFTHFRAEKNAPDFISSLTQLADAADKVCWLGCVGSSLPVYPFDFLNAHEIGELNGHGLLIPSKSEFYTYERQQQFDAIKKIQQALVLVCWDYDGHDRQEEHPLLTELKSRHKDHWKDILVENEKPLLEEEKGDIVKLGIHPDYQLHAEQLKALRCRKESFSSISSLIQHPFDYTLNYLLSLREPRIGQLDDLETTKGNVAHLFIENLVKEYGPQMPVHYKQLTAGEIDSRISDAVSQKGTILLLPEYKMELSLFAEKLKESATVLADIISHLNLVPVDCEVPMNVTLKGIGLFEAKPDMILRTAGQHSSDYVIFDFKWSESTSYEKKLKEKRAMQLELYRQAATIYYQQQDPKARIVGTAYYLFPKCQLFTTDFDKSDHIVKVEVDADAQHRLLSDELINAYAYRRHELDHGKVEDSELCDIAALSYTADTTLKLPRYPLEGQYKREKDKSCPYVKTDKPPFAKKKAVWDQSKANPQEIKTTHPILKGRLV